MTSKVSALNTTQKIPTQPIVIRKVLSPYTFYICPANKKAKIIGSAVCTGLGAAANVRLNAGGVKLVQWEAAGVIGTTVLTVGMYFDFEVQLSAGQTLDYNQDAGTNGEMNMNATVQETPA